MNSIDSIIPYVRVPILLGVMDQFFYWQVVTGLLIHSCHFLNLVEVSWLSVRNFSWAINIFISIPIFDHFHNTVWFLIFLFLLRFRNFSHDLVLLLLRKLLELSKLVIRV